MQLPRLVLLTMRFRLRSCCEKCSICSMFVRKRGQRGMTMGILTSDPPATLLSRFCDFSTLDVTLTGCVA